MKKILFLLILFAWLNATAQNSYLGLFSKSYVLDDANSGTEKKIIGNIYIVYNRDYCLFYVDGRGSNVFPTRSYTTQLIGEYIHTSFLSEETNTTPDAYYGIMVDEGKKGKGFQVSINNITYFVEKSETFSPDGRVTGNVVVKNWKEIEQKMRLDDSLRIVMQKQWQDSLIKKNIEDSFFIIRRDSLKLIKVDSQLELGNNYNQINLKWLNDTVVSKVNTDFYFTSIFKILIDKNGIVIGATPVNSLAPNFEKYVPLINKAVIGQRIKPFELNGKNYPSYAEVYISIPSEADKPKKDNKHILKSLLGKIGGL